MIPLESGLARKSAVLPTSSISTLRRKGERVATTSRMSVKPETPLAASVLTGPAETALTRIYFGPRSAARYLTEDSSAALATPMTL